jgi:hypothetical protein
MPKGVDAMRMFWGHDDDFEREFRSQRPEPRPDFLRALSRRIDEDRRHASAGSLRLGLAGVLSTMLLAVLAGFGTLGYAASGIARAAESAVSLVAPTSQTPSTDTLSSASVQYQVEICFHGKTHQVSSQAADVLVSNGAVPGACT